MTTIPPPPRSKRGSPSMFTPPQDVEIWSWYLAKVALGSYKSKAAELGTTAAVLKSRLRMIKERKAAKDDAMVKAAAKRERKFLRDVASLPF